MNENAEKGQDWDQNDGNFREPGLNKKNAQSDALQGRDREPEQGAFGDVENAEQEDHSTNMPKPANEKE
jgi:hypothetical protein